VFEAFLWSALRQLLLNDYERLPNFVQDCVQGQRQESLLRIHHHVYINGRPRAREADCFPQSPLQAISLNRSPEYAPYGKTDSQTRGLRCLPGDLRPPRQVKHSHGRRKVTAALLVNPLKVRVPQ